MRAPVIKVVLVGSPNVGKSAIFNHLTGRYAAVSNYPGTSVDIAVGQFSCNGHRFEVMDTPGLYSLIPLTEEERVTRLLLAKRRPDVIVHVVDAKNLKRMLNLTMQLLDTGIPVILNLNIMDEARQIGMMIDIVRLEQLLGIPVVATAAVSGTGMGALTKAISQYQVIKPVFIPLNEQIERSVAGISALLSRNYGFDQRSASLLILQGDESAVAVAQTEAAWPDIAAAIKQLPFRPDHNLGALVAAARQDIIDKLIAQTVVYAPPGCRERKGLAPWLGKVTRKPLTGIPILCIVLYCGLYQFVGKFGAGYLVDYINNCVFIPILIPVAQGAVNAWIPWEWLRSLLVGDYGVFTMGFRYAAAIILPIVGTFFLAFAVLEDTGYLPRLAMLADSVFRYFGLNGRAVIPLTLGLGCGTMAVMVTRTLETKRERLLATFLLSLTIPCSAQLGVVLALLSHNPAAVILWSGYLLLIFAVAGRLSTRLVPGHRSAFYMELPPLRLPLIRNVIKKASTRMTWYFREILPVFVAASAVLWAGDRSGILAALIQYLQPVMGLIGLPPAAAQAFLLGFFRRDYGAAGLYDLAAAGRLTDMQLVVAAVALTLFVPCVAQFAVMVKERGPITACIMVALIIMITFIAATFIHQLLQLGLVLGLAGGIV
ncbi:ferrous iron transport protein B [Sporomusa termitida]|uniref:Ferrous iron transport protein B n=1 Tax=Sporomusa termitida TaxID=2377 RepID=A0A517DSP2_9FIRM|nr:ferrous iron transport protein B [Sporomusa termitida]QDR80373.1 Fe(2+) transporter FeoB [Sporomusa termitida]